MLAQDRIISSQIHSHHFVNLFVMRRLDCTLLGSLRPLADAAEPGSASEAGGNRGLHTLRLQYLNSLHGGLCQTRVTLHDLNTSWRRRSSR